MDEDEEEEEEEETSKINGRINNIELGHIVRYVLNNVDLTACRRNASGFAGSKEELLAAERYLSPQACTSP